MKYASRTKSPNVEQQLKDDNECVKADKDDDGQVEPVVVQTRLHATTPSEREVKNMVNPFYITHNNNNYYIGHNIM